MMVHSIGIGQPIRTIYKVCKESVVRVAIICKNVALRIFTAIADFFRRLGAAVSARFRARMPTPVPLPGPQGVHIPDFLAPFSIIAKLTQYLPNALAVLKKGEARKEQVDMLHGWLQKGHWQDIIDKYREKPEDLATDGLKACERRLITAEQFATVTFCYALMVDFPGKEIHVEPLFLEDGSVNKAAKEAISTTMNGPPKRFIKDNADLQEKKLDEFFKKMQSEPKSEQFFLSVDTELYIPSQTPEQKYLDFFVNQSKTILELISTDNKKGFNVFHQFTKGENTYRMMPSLGMMQQFLCTYARKGDAVNISPAIGLPPEGNIRKKITENFWQMRVPFPEISFPKEIEGVKASHRVDVMGYDFYRAYTCSEIPSAIRLACMDALDVITKLKDRSGEEYKILLQALCKEMVSMNDPWFRLASDEYGTKQDDPTGICHYLIHAMNKVLSRVALEQCDGPPEEFIKKSEALYKQYGDFFEPMKQQVWEELTEKNFFSQYGIQEGFYKIVEQAEFSQPG